MKSLSSSRLPLCLFAAAIFQSEAGATTVLDLLSTWNVAANNYDMGGETEGPVFVGNTFTVNTTQQVGFNNAVDANDYALWLNNGIAGTGQVNVQSGSVVSRQPVDSGRFQFNGGAGTSLQEGDAAWQNALSEVGLNSGAEALGIYVDASNYWASLEANSTAVVDANSANFTATPELVQGHQVAIFHVTAENFVTSIGQFSGSGFGSAEGILINVAGTGDYTISGNFIGDFQNNESKVIFNFYEANSVSFNSPVDGSIFAPNSTINQTGGNVEGNIVASNFVQRNGEVHDFRFDGFAPIPEPSAALLGSFAGLLLLRRKR
ncbi:choice-of-anchor A family protein [Haloferula chungangensis]|uniref:Choice-of-anchor A family protein n=1 Tax=Haloferula chungangensis TaxID=1048331 RepID=A0ABW2L419_9BACT